jgi:DNA-binding NarL/FixJ family response regulator
MTRPATGPLSGPPSFRRPGDKIPTPRPPADDEPDRVTSSLSERDRELLRYLAAGWSTGRIAAALSVTTNTARTRIRRLQRKLAAPERRLVVQSARELGLI